MIRLAPLVATVLAGLAAVPALAQDMPVMPLGEAEFDCVIEPSQVVQVSSVAPGLLEEVLVTRGERVKKNQLIARIAAGVEQATVELLAARAASTAQIEAQIAQRDLARTRYERLQELAQRDIASVDQLAEAEAELAAAESLVTQAEVNREIAQKELERARQALADREIRSPIDGVVLQAEKSAGEYLDQSGNVATLVALDPLHVEAFLPVEHYDAILAQPRAMVSPAAPIGGRHAAQLIVIDQVFDAASATFGVRLTLPNPGEALPGGQRCQLDFPEAE